MKLTIMSILVSILKYIVSSLSLFPCDLMLGLSGPIFCLTLKETFWTLFFSPLLSFNMTLDSVFLDN